MIDSGRSSMPPPAASGNALRNTATSGQHGRSSQLPTTQGFVRASTLSNQQPPSAAPPPSAPRQQATGPVTTISPRLTFLIPNIPAVSKFELNDIPNLQIVRDSKGKRKHIGGGGGGGR